MSVKSGRDADFWVKASGEDNDRDWVKIKGTKDISKYVVWTCPEPSCPPNGGVAG